MPLPPAPIDFALLLGLSFFLGIRLRGFLRAYRKEAAGRHPHLSAARGRRRRALSARSHPFRPIHGRARLVLGAWLFVYYQKHIGEPDDQDETDDPNVGIVAPLLNVHAYLLGAIALALPHWLAVTATVTAVLFLTGRRQLHGLARRVEVKEIITAGQFLILTGIILPLLPNTPVTSLTGITPRQVWLALVVVCTFSYLSLAQRYWAAAAGGLWMAALGGLYSSTATTVVLGAGQSRTRNQAGRPAPASRSPPPSCICASWRSSAFST